MASNVYIKSTTTIRDLETVSNTTLLKHFLVKGPFCGSTLLKPVFDYNTALVCILTWVLKDIWLNQPKLLFLICPFGEVFQFVVFFLKNTNRKWRNVSFNFIFLLPKMTTQVKLMRLLMTLWCVPIVSFVGP